MRSNALLKWLMIPMLLLVLFVGMKLFSSKDGSETAGDSTPRLTAGEMKALGIEGDTPRDTVATLVAQVKALRDELRTTLEANKSHLAENARLRQRENAVEARISGALTDEREQLREERERIGSDRQQAQSLLQELEQRFDTLTGKSKTPAGLGLEDGDGSGFSGDGVRWIEPAGTRDAKGKRDGGDGKRKGAFDFASAAPIEATAQDGETASIADDQAKPTPVYTVPANATLTGSVAMTALIGRVPIDGTVNDPYPFKVLVGADNLAANGIEIPDVAGAVISGTTSGDWTLSCVRGQIRSVTFVFNDGTIRTVPDRNTAGGSSGGAQKELGWISDPHGIPCVSGERRSNAQQYLGSQALVTAAGAGAASLIKSEDGRVGFVGNSDGAIGTVGISGNEAMGRILAGGVREMSEWINKLYGQAFAVVYVPPGARVAVHLEQPLNIDHDAKGRRVDHRTGESHVSTLD